MSKVTTIRTEAQLLHAARAVLESDDVFHWQWKPLDTRHDRGIDAVVELEVDGRRLTFDIECKLAPSARDVERLAHRERVQPPLLIAPSLSEVLVRHCRERRINCLDLNGRQWIRAKGLVVDRKPGEGRLYRPLLPQPDLFQPKSSRLIRSLLCHPGRTWAQAELGQRTGLSPGLISRLLRHLENEGYVARHARSFQVSRPDALLDAWATADNWAKRTTVRQYSVLESDLEVVARKLVKISTSDKTPVFTQWFAANLRHPYTVPPVVSAYVSQYPERDVEEKLRARPVSDGGTLWLVIPNDEGVFRETQRVGNFTLACDAQIYLDLQHSGFRGPDQAKALREWEGFGKGRK